MKELPFHCAEPWQKLAITLPGLVPFCFSSPGGVAGRMDDDTPWSVAWNSPAMQQFRNDIRGIPPVQAHCKVCSHVSTNAVPHFVKDAEGFGSDTPYGENVRLQFQEYVAGAVHLKSLPTILHLEPSALCNLNCTMCSQTNVKQKAYESKKIDDVVRELLPVLTLLNWSGGEPLMQRSFNAFLDLFSDKVNPYCSVSIQSNGQLFGEKHYRMLRQARNAIVTLSIDGIGSVYEAIRRGGSWSRLDRIVSELVRLRDAFPNIYISAAFTIQKNNVLNIPQFLEWCIAKRLPAQFMSVFNYPVNLRPDVFQRCGKETAGWRDALDAALTLSKALDVETSTMTNPLSGVASKAQDYIDYYRKKITASLDKGSSVFLRKIHVHGANTQNAFVVIRDDHDVVTYGSVAVDGFHVSLPAGRYTAAVYSSPYEEHLLAKDLVFTAEDGADIVLAL
jgi:hypothetical protein